MRIDPVCLIPVNSQEDIDAVLARNEYFQIKISRILVSDFRGDVRGLEIALELGHRFKTAYFQSIGSPYVNEVSVDFNAYRELLNRSIDVSSHVNSFVISALKCHQRAYDHFMRGVDRASAIAEMEKSFEFAKVVSEKIFNLSEEFSKLRVRIVAQTIMMACNEHISVARTIREWNGPVNGRFQQLKECEASLSHNLDLLWIIEKKFLYIEIFLASLSKNYCDWLPDSMLADADVIEILEESISDTSYSDESGSEILESSNSLLEVATEITIPKKPPAKMQMKTGVTLFYTIQKPSSQKMSDLQITYEKSYLKWLGLAKVNRAMTNAMKEALNDIEDTEAHILHLQKDPLFIALNSCI